MMHNLFELVTARARTDAGQIAIGNPRRSLTYLEFEQLALGISAQLSQETFRAGDRLLLAIRDEINLFGAIFACAHLGICFTTLRSSFPIAFRKRIAEEIGVSSALVDHPAQSIPGIRSITLDVNRGAPHRPHATLDELARSASYPFSISIGSGSTGKPKKIISSHQQELQRIEVRKRLFVLTDADIVSHLSSSDFVSVRRHYMSAFAVGARVELLDRTTANPWSQVSKSRINVIHTPAMGLHQALKECFTWQGSPPHLPNLRILSTGGSMISEALRADVIRSLTTKLHVLYGANEYGLISCATPDQLSRVPDTVGKPPTGTSVQIVDDAGEPVGPNRLGHIRVRGDQQITGYLDDEPNTREHFRDGWFYPGDVATMTEDGQIVFRGRADDMMIFNGINVFPAEIESLVASLPGVVDCAAIPFSHAIHQDVPCCAVVLSDGVRTGSDELLQEARRHLGPASLHRVVIVEAIPRNEAGKLLRPELRRLMAQTVQRQQTSSGQAAAEGHVLDNAPVRPRLVAPWRVVEARFAPPPTPDLRRLDLWLSHAWNAPQDIHRRKPPPETADEDSAAGWIRRVLRLAQLGFEVARIPVFDELRLIRREPVRDEPRPPSWRVLLEVARVDEVPRRAYERIVESAERLCHWAHGKAPDDTSVQSFFDRLVDEFERPYRGLAATGDSTLPLLREAHRAGIPYLHLGRGLYQLGWGRHGIWLDRSATETDSAVGRKVSSRKELTAALLRRAGLPAPVHQVVAALPAALDASRRLGWPVVVKPVDGERGEGVSVDVTDADSLELAFELAQRASPSRRVLVERQVAGTCHRLFVVDGRLLYAVKRMPLSVIGDGRRSVAELLDAAIREDMRLPPWHREGYLPMDDPARRALAAQSLSSDTVPSPGALVPLRRIESTAWGGTDEDVSCSVHPDNLELALEAARLFRLQVAGIDVISADIGKPWHANGAIVNEVNFSPLLGGGAISRRHIGEYLSRTVDADGRIPVEVYAGGPAAWARALSRQSEWRALGRRCWVVGMHRVVQPDGRNSPTLLRGWLARAQPALLDRSADGLLLVVDHEAALSDGLPLDRVDSVDIVDLKWTVSEDPGIAAKRTPAVLAMLRRWQQEAAAASPQGG